MEGGMKKFNFVVAAIALLFIVGILWQWRGALRRGQMDSTVERVVPSVTQETADERSGNLAIGEFGNVASNTPSENTPVPNYPITELPNYQSVSSTLVLEVADLPKSVNLAVPFTSQAPEKDWSQPWQAACGEAAGLMLDAY